MFAVIAPSFRSYSKLKESTDKLIYCVFSKKLLTSNGKNKTLENNLNIFKYLTSSKNDNKSTIELYPNCLTCDTNSEYHYTKTINKDKLKNIYIPSDANVVLPKINNFTNYSFKYITKGFPITLELKALDKLTNLFIKYIYLDNTTNIKTFSNLPNTNKVLLYRYNNNILKLFIQTDDSNKINSTTLNNYVENKGNSVLKEDITGNITDNTKYNILFEFDISKNGFYIYYVKNSQKYYLIDPDLSIGSTYTNDKLNFVTNNLNIRQLFRIYQNDVDVSKEFIMYDITTNNPFYIGNTNKEFCNQAPSIEPNTKYDIPIGKIPINRTFKKCLQECVDDPACKQITFNNEDHDNNINNEGECYKLDTISKIDENKLLNSDIEFNYKIKPQITTSSGTNIFSCKLSKVANDKFVLDVTDVTDNYKNELVNNVKIIFTEDLLPGKELSKNILYTIKDVTKPDSNTINMNIKNFPSNIAIDEIDVTIKIMPYFTINLSTDNTQSLNIKNISHLSQEINKPQLFTLNNGHSGAIPYIFLPADPTTLANPKKELTDNSAFYISFSHRIGNINYYELILYPQDTQAFIQIENIDATSIEGRLSKVIETSVISGGRNKILGGNTADQSATGTLTEAEKAAAEAERAAAAEKARVDGIKKEFTDIEGTITQTCNQLKTSLETKNIEPCNTYVPSPDHNIYINDANVKTDLNTVKNKIDEYNSKLENLEAGITIQQKDYSNMKINVQTMIDTINNLERREQKEREINDMLSNDNLNKAELRKILEDANKNNIKLGAKVVQDIRNKLADDKWKPKDWISATCNIKKCSDNQTNEPPIIQNEDSYENYLFYEHPFEVTENKYLYYNKETSSCLAMDVEGNVYALKLDKDPLQLKYEVIRSRYQECIFTKINMGRGDALSVCSSCNNINNVETQQTNIKKPITSMLKGISSINNKPKAEYGDYLIVKNNDLYNKYKKLLDKNSTGSQTSTESDNTDLNNFIDAIFKDTLDVGKYLVKFDIHNPNPIVDNETYKTCKKSFSTIDAPYYSSPDVYNKLIKGRLRFINNDNTEIDDADIDYIKSIFEDTSMLPNMNTVPEKFVGNNDREIKNYLSNLMILKLSNGKDTTKTLSESDYDEKYQMYIIAEKGNNITFKNSIKIFNDPLNEIHCPAVLNQKTGRLLDTYTDNDLFYIINLEPIFKFYSLNEKDNIILEEINETDENAEEIALKIKNILSNKITLFTNKSNNKVLTQEEKDLILTEEQTKRLTRQKNAWKIVGGKNFNGDISKLFNKLEVVKDITYPTTSVSNTNKPLNNLDFNKTLMKIKFKYIKGDRGWKISNNSIFNKNLFNEETFDKIHEGERIYKYPVKFNINDKIHSHIPGNKLDIEILFENVFYNKWFFEEVTYLANKPNDYKNNPTLLSYLNNNNIDTKVEGEISHSLIENNYIITSKLFEKSELIYNDLTSNYITEKDLDMNIYYYTKPTESSQYIDLNKSDIVNQMKKLYYGENSNKNDAKKYIYKLHK